MEIYVVKPGDTLWTIGRKFGVTPTEIARVNRVRTPDRLVVGQALVIPTGTKRYTVKPGDSLQSIAQGYDVSEAALLSVNPIAPPYSLHVGQVIHIPSIRKKYGPIETNGYLLPGNDERDRRIIEEVAPYLTYLTLFSYRARPDGSLEPLNDTNAVRTALANRIAPMMAVTNFAEGNFSPDLASDILTNTTIQDRLFANILTTLQTKGYRVLNIDFEHIYPEQRNLYNNFLRRITAFMHEHNILVSTALAPKNYDIKRGAWHGAHDYAAHGQIVDFVIIMTYEWGWSGGPPVTIGMHIIAGINLYSNTNIYA
ncbi:LysM peptidoglycan-binding domain-containing protein [Aneurinibacillus terranovensis]|uniref:LysM peptidoglycan-binding domain-containing protein n=1 Tax=Aneurinibacillus terranovensis TaxID=278991 RepID=UPI0003F7E40B|nr:LysM peptidoglycan-binding domain-containing protein [Aneurinibacillus terranovensis]